MCLLEQAHVVDGVDEHFNIKAWGEKDRYSTQSFGFGRVQRSRRIRMRPRPTLGAQPYRTKNARHLRLGSILVCPVSPVDKPAPVDLSHRQSSYDGASYEHLNTLHHSYQPAACSESMMQMCYCQQRVLLDRDWPVQQLGTCLIFYALTTAMPAEHGTFEPGGLITKVLHV